MTTESEVGNDVMKLFDVCFYHAVCPYAVKGCTKKRQRGCEVLK